MLVILKAAMGAENGVLAAAHGVGVGDVVDDIHDFFCGWMADVFHCHLKHVIQWRWKHRLFFEMS